VGLPINRDIVRQLLEQIEHYARDCPQNAGAGKNGCRHPASDRLVKIASLGLPSEPAFDSFEARLLSGRRVRIQVTVIEEEEPPCAPNQPSF